MGITIHYTLGIWNKDALNKVLQQTKEEALSLGMEIKCHEPNKLRINPDEESEWLVFDFKTWKEVKEEGSLKRKRIEEYLPILTSKELLPILSPKALDKELDARNKRYEKVLVCADSCKTQFAGKEVHKQVAELLRLVASRCSFVCISDEGDYYETQDINEAGKNIATTESLIKSITSYLSGSGLEVSSRYDMMKEKQGVSKEDNKVIKASKSRDIPIVEVAKEIKKVLKRRFPETKFSIRTERYSFDENVRIRWYEGPALKKIEKITQVYEDIRTDPQTGGILRGGNRYVFCEREINDETFEQVKQQLNEKLGSTVNDLYVMEQIDKRDLRIRGPKTYSNFFSI